MKTLQFTRFPSLVNTFQQKPLEVAIECGFDQRQWQATEKVHGANLSFWIEEVEVAVEGIGLCSSINITPASRNGFIEEGEKFYNFRPVLAKYRTRLENLYRSLSDSCDVLVVTGELFGGNVATGVDYAQEQDWVAFDMALDGVPVNKLAMRADLDTHGIPCVPLLGVYTDLQKALEANETFESNLLSDYPDMIAGLRNREAEGIVIEPVIPCWFPNEDNDRVYFKKKTLKFSEKKQSKMPKPKVVLPDDVMEILVQSQDYMTDNRFASLESKTGGLTIKHIGSATTQFVADVLVDMKRDDILIPDHEGFDKALYKTAETFIRPFLLQRL